MNLRGRVHKYGADVNTDVIIPARYLNTIDPQELAAHCMEDIDTEFLRRVRPGWRWGRAPGWSRSRSWPRPR